MTSAIKRHMDEATLVSFAAGTLNEALAAVVASHVSMCKHCKQDLSILEDVGGSLLGSLPLPIVGSAAEVTPANISPQPEKSGTSKRKTGNGIPAWLPAPMATRYGQELSTLRWKVLAPGVWHHRFKLSNSGPGDLRLLKIAPGAPMLVHGHRGTELTLVLDGAFTDATGEYYVGDIQDVAEETEHRPIADHVSGCICLIASERKARFHSLTGKLAQLWTGL